MTSLSDYQWVIGRFVGEQGKTVASHANAGLGYHILKSEGVGMHHFILAAFKRSTAEPLPHHLETATPDQIDKLEKRDARRRGERDVYV